MSINTIVNDVITQLETTITGLKVELFPDKLSEYRLIHSHGAVLVAYSKSSFSNPERIEFIQQIETIEIGIELIIKGLRDKNGAYDYLDTIKTTLTGFAPTGCTKMYPTQSSFLAENSGIWQYGFVFETTKENYD